MKRNKTGFTACLAVMALFMLVGATRTVVRPFEQLHSVLAAISSQNELGKVLLQAERAAKGE